MTQARKLVSRIDAISAGLITYFTGKACKRGHISERYTQNSTCVMCVREATYADRKRIKEIRAAHR